MRTFTLNKVKQGLEAKTGTKVILCAELESRNNHCGLIFFGGGGEEKKKKRERNDNILLQNSPDN